MNFRPTGKLNEFMEMNSTDKKKFMDKIAETVESKKEEFEPFKILEGFMPQKEVYDEPDPEELDAYFDLLVAEYEFEKMFESRYNNLYETDDTDYDYDDYDTFYDDEEEEY